MTIARKLIEEELAMSFEELYEVAYGDVQYAPVRYMLRNVLHLMEMAETAEHQYRDALTQVRAVMESRLKMIDRGTIPNGLGELQGMGPAVDVWASAVVAQISALSVSLSSLSKYLREYDIDLKK